MAKREKSEVNENALALAARTRSAALLTEAETFVSRHIPEEITTQQEYEDAGHFLVLVTKKKKEVEEARFTITRQIDSLKTSIMGLFAPSTKKYTDAEKIVKVKMLNYLNSVRETRRKQQEELGKLQLEKRAKEVEEAKKKAQKLEKIGDLEGAEYEMQKAVQSPQVVPPVLKIDDPKVTGISQRVVWKYDVEDLDKVPEEYWMLDHIKISRVVKASSGTIPIPGIRIYSEEITAVRTAGTENIE
jgi:hypothetical protein